MRAIGLRAVCSLPTALLPLLPSLAALTICRPASGQAPPIADNVQGPLLPSGITEHPIDLSGELVTLFEDQDGANALHFVGDFALTFGDPKATQLSAAEAIIWIHERTYQNRPYRHLEIFLWRDAVIVEAGGTRTIGPLLFVTMNTFGEVRSHADDVARAPFADPTAGEVYQQGNAIRKALTDAKVQLPDEQVALGVFDPAAAAQREAEPAVRPILYFQSPGKLTLERIGDRQVLIITGGVYMGRGTPDGQQFLEIQSDNAVVFFAPGAEPAMLGQPAEGDAETAGQPRPQPRPDRQFMDTSFGAVEVEGAYLEGDIRMAQGPHSIRASKLYYDFTDERALILDAVARTVVEARGIPLYLRAEEIRQLSTSRYVATDAMLTTSEFHTPHYHVGAERVELTTEPGAITGLAGGSVRGGVFDIRNATLNLYGIPVAYWPHLRGTLDTSETSIRSIRTGYSGDFGFEFEVNWHLFNLLGYETPEGFDATLSTGFFTDRGPYVGANVNYLRDRYFGETRSFLMYDGGEDDLGQDRDDVDHEGSRGRMLWRHRQYLEDDWQLSLEFAYISDSTFLEEYFESEYDNEKEQETLVYLKKQRDNWAFTILLQTRLLDFLTQTERYPDLAFFVAGKSLGDRLTWYSENRAGLLEYRVGDRTLRDFLREGRIEGSDLTARADTRQELETPIDIGPWRIVPFAAGRGTTWSDSPDEGGVSRGFGMIGFRGSMFLTKTNPDYNWELFDINGVRHIIKPDFVVWTSEANHSADELFPFDYSVEGIDATDGAMFGIRQRWQTKRGPADNRRTVDVLTADVEVAVFNDSENDATTNGYTSFGRPENSIARNHLRTATIWRVNDRTAVLTENVFDLNDNRLDISNVSVAVERTPRFSYLVGYRLIDDTDSNLLGLDMNYRLTEKHTLALRELFDLDEGRTLDFTIGLIRKFPSWFGALSFELDESEDDFGVSFSVWPEGLPQAALGSRRFTGLATSTRVEAD